MDNTNTKAPCQVENKKSPPISQGTQKFNLNKVNEKYSTGNPLSSEISQAPEKSPFSSENQSNNLHENEVSKDYLDIRANLGVQHISEIAFVAIAEACKINCGGTWWARECGCKEDNPRIEKMHGCMNENCISCSDDINIRRTRKCVERINVLRGNSPVCYTVFTVPPELRIKFQDTVVWGRCVKRILGVLKKKYGLKYGLGSYHPIGDRNPNIFHPHLDLVWIQKIVFFAFFGEGEQKEKKELKPFLDDQQLKELKKAWKKIIGAEGVVDVFHNYTENEGLIFKRVDYCIRPFPGWKFWRGKAVRWYGKYPREGKDYNAEKYEFPQDEICEICGQKIRRWIIRDYLHGESLYKSGFT